MASNKTMILLIILVIASRLPLLSNGFGADGDGWRIAKTALTLWNDGEYHVSRFPGFPVYEFIQTPIIALGGSIASNVSSLFIFIVSLIFFRKILHRWNVPHSDLVLVAYAFLPILWKNSSLTMDYVWGLCGIVSAVYLVGQKRFTVAGVVLGLAAGTRISHIAYLLPLFFLFQKEERKQWLVFSATALLTTIACYIPVFLSEGYGLVVRDYLADTRNYSTLRKIGFYFYRLIFSLGLLGWIGIVTAVVLNRKNIALLFQKHFLTSVVAFIATGLLLFAVVPDEREYLIPIFPFLLIALASSISQKQYFVILLLLISYGFISVDILDHQIKSPTLKLNIQRGYIVKEFLERREINERRLQLAQVTVPDSSFIMIGIGPLFWLENPYVEVARGIEKEFRHDCAKSLRGNEVYFIYALYKPQLDEIRRRGYSVYYWDEMKEYLETFLDYKLEDERVLPLHVSIK